MRAASFFGLSGVSTILAMDYLLKTEPSVYSFANLQKEKSTIWDGVTNPVAVKNLRGMQVGDRLVIYHTGDEKSAVGTAVVEAVEVTDPKAPRIRIKVAKAIAAPKTLAEIKTQKLFAESALVRQGRLSVVPLTAAQFQYLVQG
jgi:predicted RNA-binding protein with PUA-like domain